MKKTIAMMLLFCLMTIGLVGCQRQSDPVDSKAGIAAYMTTARAQSDAIKTSLEKDALTQNELNQKSGELYDLWEKAMNRLLEEAEKTLPAAEKAKLTAEQSAWLETRTQAMDAAGKDVEGGSVYALVVNMEAARLTEARTNELYELLK